MRFIENSIDKPYEIHLVEFEGEQDFINFMHDEDRKKVFAFKGTIDRIIGTVQRRCEALDTRFF